MSVVCCFWQSNECRWDYNFQILRDMNPAAKGKALTLELVFNKTKSDNLNNIKNLNLWGNDLEDLRLVEKMPNLEVISLSVNKINSLKDFSNCNKLHVLRLSHRNSISEKIASPISGKSSTFSTYLTSSLCGYMTTLALSMRTTERLCFTISPISTNSTTT